MNTVKTNIQNLTMLSAVIAFASCESHKQSKISESGTEMIKLRTPVKDTLQQHKLPNLKAITVSGKVLYIHQGKDGYTAKIETEKIEFYFATVSRSNLKDHSQYKMPKVGDVLQVTGDYWLMGDDKQITVRELQ